MKRLFITGLLTGTYSLVCCLLLDNVEWGPAMQSWLHGTSVLVPFIGNVYAIGAVIGKAI